MSTEQTNENTQKPHSADYFGETRDFWWNHEFLELMAKRWRLGEVSIVLDAGCGIGHWGRALAPHLNRLENLTGVDREEKWITEAAVRAQRSRLAGKAHYLKADVMELPFEDASFDMVTCQTLLIHLKNPQAAIREFMRVLKPKGLLAVVEPNNLANVLVRSNLDVAEPIDRLVASAKLHALCQRGKVLLGEGDNSLGDLVPGYFNEAGLDEIQVYLSDKVSPLLPPYDSAEQRAIVEEIHDRRAREMWLWEEHETWRYFEAAGGTRTEFDELWRQAADNFRAVDEACQARRYHSGGASMSYLVSGRKK